MHMTRTLKGPTDRTLNRLIVGIVLVLVIGIPVVGVLYFLDRYVDPGPTMLQRSIAAAEEAVRQNPNQVGARMALAVSYAESQRYADAVAQYSEVLKAQADNRLALIERGKAELVLDDLDAAAADFQKLVDAAKGGEMANVDPQLEEAYYNLGAIELKRDRPKEAVIQLSNALRINRTDADALYLLGTALVRTGDYETAATALRKAVALVPSGWCEPYAALDDAYTGLQDAAGAQYAGGMVAVCEGRPVDAKARLEPLTAGPLAVDALLGLGLLAEGQGDGAGAAAYYDQVLAKDPQNFGAITGLNRLGGSGDAHASPSVAAPSASPSGGD